MSEQWQNRICGFRTTHQFFFIEGNACTLLNAGFGNLFFILVMSRCPFKLYDSWSNLLLVSFMYRILENAIASSFRLGKRKCFCAIYKFVEFCMVFEWILGRRCTFPRAFKASTCIWQLPLLASPGQIGGLRKWSILKRSVCITSREFASTL